MDTQRNDDRRGRAAVPPRARNRLFAFVLSAVAVGVFATVMTIVVVFHEVETHHVVAHL